MFASIGPTPADLEFNSLEVNVDIVPTFALPLILGLDGSSVKYGPLNPPHKSTVPLWMALQLKKKRQCRIIFPNWLSIGELEATLHTETSGGAFAPVHPDFTTLAKVLFENASDDHMAPDRARLLLKDIRECRQAKIRQGLAQLSSIHLSVENLTRMELNEIRGFFFKAHSRLVALDPDRDKRKDIEDLWMQKPMTALRMAEAGEIGPDAAAGDDRMGEYD